MKLEAVKITSGMMRCMFMKILRVQDHNRLDARDGNGTDASMPSLLRGQAHGGQ